MQKSTKLKKRSPELEKLSAKKKSEKRNQEIKKSIWKKKSSKKCDDPMEQKIWFSQI